MNGRRNIFTRTRDDIVSRWGVRLGFGDVRSVGQCRRWRSLRTDSNRRHWQVQTERIRASLKAQLIWPSNHRYRRFFFFLGQRTNSVFFRISYHLISPPFRSRPPEYSWEVWGSAVSSPSGVWGEASADKRFGEYWSQKVQLWWQQWQQFLFLRTNVIFCTNTSLISYFGSNCVTVKSTQIELVLPAFLSTPGLFTKL